MLAKIAIWVFILAGLTPAVLLAFISYAMQLGNQQITLRQFARSPQPDLPEIIFVHDTYLKIAGQRWELAIYPRIWASSIVVAGVLAVVIGLFFLLHVPQSHSS